MSLSLSYGATLHSVLAVKGSRATRAVVHCRMARKATAKLEETSMFDCLSENVWFGNEAVGIAAFVGGIESPL